MGFKVQDHYFKKAKKDSYLARSVYKLEEIDAKYKVIEKGNQVMDLGYHPGSWIQYTAKKVGAEGLVIGADIRGVNKKLLSLKNVRVFEQDVFDIEGLETLGVSEQFDVLLSDMAPNTTGIRSVDQDRSYNLVEMIFHLLPKLLKKDGNLVIKVFDGHEVQNFLKNQRPLFHEFSFLKPKSTRSVSKEFFVIGKKYKA